MCAKRESLKKGRWKPEEIARLKKLFEGNTGSEIAKALNRPLPTVRQKIFKLGLKKRQYSGWGVEEEKLLREVFPTTTTKQVAKELGRTVNSVREKAHRMGLKKTREHLMSYGLAPVTDRDFNVAEELGI